ncbi:uncharacterized protein [Euphorbia lathyris]|uniref:uncharacterized protein isoform X2 n=1 Tax=Euphorbia lathyris TaxID=212925 RepID=UPI0033132D3E
MASNPPQTVEDPCNTETDEETIALKKKRSRRVSFADREITSVHIFNRDEDYETPPDSSARNPSSDSVSEAEKEVLGFFRDLVDSDDSKEMSPNLDEDYDDDVINARRSFLRPVESPSPGSSIFGSATSNDEDNFFGPVSTSFIRPGQQSDSAASDDNHDVTMDSTVFSMHYRSLARSDSGGNTFEEKTPSQVTTPSDFGSSMVLTKVKKMIPRFSLSEKFSGGRDSNDMSLVGENPHNYGYEKLSPKLEELLAVSSKDLQDVSVSDFPNKNASKSSEIPVFDGNMGDHIDQKDHRDKETGNIGKLGLSPEGVSSVCMELDELNGNSLNTLVGLVASGCSSRRDEDLAANVFVDQRLQTPNQLAKVNKNYTECVNGINTLNVEIPSGDHQSINGEVPQLDSFVHEFRENPNGSSHVKRRDNYGIDQNFDQQKSPAHGSISSVSAKQQEIYLDTAITCEHLSYVTPSPKQPNSFLGKGTIKSGGKNFSVNKSISKFQIFEPSPLASALKERIESSKLRLSKLLSSTTLPFIAVAEESCKSVERKNVDAVVANLEKHLFCTDANDRCQERTDHVDSAGIQKQKEYDSLSKDDRSKCLAEDRVSVISMSTHVSFEGANQLMTRVASPSQFSQLQKIERQHNLMPAKFVQKTAIVSGSDSSLVDIKLNNENDAKAIVLPDEFVSPTTKTLEKISCSSTKQQCTSLHDFQPDEMVSMSLGQDKCSVGKVISNSNSTVITDVLRTSFPDEGAQSSSPLPDINGFVDFNQVGNFHDWQNYPTVLKHAPETLPISRSPSRERNSQKVLSGSPYRNMLAATGFVHSEKEVPGEWNEASPPASASHDISRRIKNITERPFKKEMFKSPIKEPTHSPSRKDQHGVSDNENMQSFAGKSIVSPNSNVNCRVDSGNHLNGIPPQNIENSSERKRRFEESVAENEDKYRRIKRSPEIHTSEDAKLEVVLEYAIGSDNTRQNTSSDQMTKHWSDILQKFLEDTEQLLSPLTGKLNTKLLSRLQDIVLHLQKKMSDQSSEIRLNRVAETKMLLYKLAYQKARLQLMHMEREKVLKKSQQLSSALHKSQMLKLNRQCLLLSGSRNSAANNLRCTSDMSSKTGLSWEKLAAMKHDFEVIDRKIKNLTKSFNSYLRMKGEPSCSEIIAQLNVHLKKKTSCKIIHDDLQLWEIDDFGSMNLKRSIALNYRGLFCQRFVINGSPTPSVFVSNNLDGTNITKNFPNMDACTAFAWTLNARSKKKLVGFKIFAQETQITCSLLHNLLDVFGEVQLALLEIRNLVQTRFCSSVEQLQLQLCFIDFNNGWRMMVTLDMTCLNRGVYPSEVVPSQLEASFAGTCMPVPESLVARITAAVDGLGAGYSRIIRLCRCISQVVCSP